MVKQGTRLMIVLSILLMVSVASAQEAVKLAYGDIARGEITNSTFELEYVFAGQAGDIVVIEIAGDAESYSDAIEPMLFVIDPNGTQIIESEDGLPLKIATVSLVLPEDGAYTIIATREDGRSGEDEGNFILRLMQPQALLPGEVIEGRVDGETGNQYYVVVGEEAPTIHFRMNTAVRFAPQFTIRDAANYEDLLAYYVALTTASSGSISIANGEFYLVGVEYEKSDLLIYDEIEATYSVMLEDE